MNNLCLFNLVSFLLASVYCSVENRTETYTFLEKLFTPGDGIQVQNLFVASCESIEDDLNSVKTSMTDQNKQMQCMVSSIEEVFNIANESNENVIKQNNLVGNLVGSVASLNSRLVSQEDQSKTIGELLDAQEEQLQMLTALMTEFISKKKEESEIVTVMSCPEDFEEFQGKCYKFHQNKKTWTDASEFCRKNEGFLAEPKSKFENDFVRDIINRDGVYSIWLGGSDKSKEGEWRWESNGDIISGFTYWYDGEHPDFNNQPRNDYGNEDCVMKMLFDVDGRWLADDCDRQGFFVCQTTKVPSPQTTTKD